MAEGRPDDSGMEHWCQQCHRLIATGCTCGMSFSDKIKSIQINKNSFRGGPRKGKRR